MAINLHGTEPKPQIVPINRLNHLDSVRRRENNALFVCLSLCEWLQSSLTDVFFYGRVVHSSVLCCFIKAYIERDCVDKQVYSAFTTCFLLSSACNAAKNRLCAETIFSAAPLRSHERCERCNLLKKQAPYVCRGMCEASLEAFNHDGLGTANYLISTSKVHFGFVSVAIIHEI